MKTATLRDAATGLGHFYVPRFEITAGGKGLAPQVLRDVVRVAYNDSTTEIDSFDVTVNNWDADERRFKYVGAEKSTRSAEPLHTLFEPCARDFELKLGYGARLTSVMTGSPTSLEPSFPAGGAPTLTMRAVNVLSKLRTKRHRGHWTEKRISQVAEDIGRRTERDGSRRFPIPIRLAPAPVRRREPTLPYMAQENQFDIDFLLLEARRIGYVVYVDRVAGGAGREAEVLYFGPSDAKHPGVPDVTRELEWGVSLIDFAPKLTTSNQVASVEVRSWDRETNRAIRKKVTARHPDLRINRDLLHLVDPGDGSRCRPREEVIVNEPQFTGEQAERRALAVMEEKLKNMVEATGSTVGLPDLRAGRRVRIVGVGARFSGTYFVVKTTHTIDDHGYITKFTARREQGEGPA